MFLFASPCQPDNRSARIRIPIRCPHAGKCRNNINTIGIRDSLGIFLGLSCGTDHTHPVPQPLDGRPCHKNTSLKCIFHFPCSTRSNGRKQSMSGNDWFLSGMHQKKTTGSIGIFYISFFKTALSEQCRLLVSCHTHHRNFTAKNLLLCLSEETTRRPHFRQHFFGNAKQL